MLQRIVETKQDWKFWNYHIQFIFWKLGIKSNHL